MSEAKTLEQRLVDTVLPFYSWCVLKMLKCLGLPFGREEARALARHFLPPPAFVLRSVRRRGGRFLSPALHSPAYRRRLRKAFAQVINNDLAEAEREKAPGLVAARAVVSQFADSLAASGLRGRRKIVELLENHTLRDFEEEVQQELAALSENPEVIGQLFPPTEVIDPRLRRKILVEFGPEASRVAVVGLLCEFLLGGESTAEPRITKKSKYWAIFGVDQCELFGLAPGCSEESLRQAIERVRGSREEQTAVARRFFEAASSFLTGSDEEELQSKLINALRWLVRSHLPIALLGKGYYVPLASIDAPVGENVTLGDVIADPRAQDAFDLSEMRLDYELWLEQLPAAQSAAVKLEQEAVERNLTLQAVCRERGEDYAATRKNLERARKRRHKGA